MVEELLPRQHRILVIAEMRQCGLQEMRECRLGIGAGGGKPEGFERPEMVGKTCLDQINHLAGDRIGGKAQRLRHQKVALRGLAVVMVEIPLAAFRLLAVHQQPGLAAHLAVEILHAQRLAPLSPAIELGMAGDETVVGEDLNIQGRIKRLQALQHAPLAGFGHADMGGTMPLGSAEQFARKAAAIAGTIQPNIIDLPAGQTQLFGEMAHCGKEESNLLFMMANIACLTHNLGHQHDGFIRRHTLQ